MEPELRRLLRLLSTAPSRLRGRSLCWQAAPSPTPHSLARSWITPPCCRHPRPSHRPAHQGQGQHTDPKTFQELGTLHRLQRRFRTPTAVASGVLHHLRACSRGQSVLCGSPHAVQLIQRCCRRAGCSRRSSCAMSAAAAAGMHGPLWRRRHSPAPCSSAHSALLLTGRSKNPHTGCQRQCAAADCRPPLQQRIPNLTRSDRESVGAGCAARQLQAIVAPHSGHGG